MYGVRDITSRHGRERLLRDQNEDSARAHFRHL
jgi:hypothetical protein